VALKLVDCWIRHRIDQLANLGIEDLPRPSSFPITASCSASTG
jgi:hypothetical protein